MKKIQFQYSKTPENPTDREAIILSKPSNNYFTVDITKLSTQERQELEEGLIELQKGIDEAFILRTEWLRKKGFGNNFRNFNKDKMSLVV
jgi:hypothetical protein